MAEKAVRIGNHFMYELSQGGYDIGTGAQASNVKPPARPCFVCVNVVGFQQEEETFSFRIRLYLVVQNGHSRTLKEPIALSLDEQREITLPDLHWANAAEVEATDEPTVKLLSRNNSVMWNQAFRISVRHHFDLRNLPFDTQSVKLSLHLNSPHQWELFNIRCAQVTSTKVFTTTWAGRTH